MIASLKPYPAYKDSGVPWLGKVPEHWELGRLRDSVNGCINGIWGDEPNGHEDLPCVRVADFDRQRLRVRLTRPTMRAITPNERRRRVLKKGDLLLEKSGGGDLQPVGVVVLYDHETSAVCSNFVARLPVASGYDSDYLTYLHACLYSIRLNVRSVKQTTGIQNLDSSAYLGEAIAFPFLVEQAVIARFLNYMDRRIWRYIRAKKTMIKLLEEQKQAIIHRAVTGQIDVRTGRPYPAYKASGVEWLGDVPEHWGFNRGKCYFREVDVRSTSGEEELLSVSHITGVTPRSQKNITMFMAESSVGFKICTPGQIAVNTMWAWMAAIGVSRYRGLISPSYHTYEQLDSDRFADEFLDLLLRTHLYRAFFTINSSGITTSRLRLYPNDFLNVRFLCPPRHEQDAMLEWFHDATTHIDNAIARASREIELLNEFRTRLVADVVTGKLDVREAAARLPDEAGEPEFVEDAETDADDDIAGDLEAAPEVPDA